MLIKYSALSIALINCQVRESEEGGGHDNRVQVIERVAIAPNPTISKTKKRRREFDMKKLAVFNLVLVLSLVLGGVALAQTGDFGVAQRTAETALEGWSPTISADALYENLNDGDTSNDPFIVSVRSADHYALGHVPGAINIPWSQIANADNLAKLPTDRQIVTYCYTGHTGQVAATVLKVLGYDAVNLKYGMMGWTTDDEVLATTRFDPETQPDYAIEGTAAEAPAEEEAAQPPTLPETGGLAFPVESVLVGFGALTAAAGLYLRRRNAA
jgi:rhodanese-related sulfurtransferase